MSSSDDLTALLVSDRPNPGTVGYRQGVVRTWDQQTAENTVQVGGSVLSDLAILNTNEAVLLQPGDVVGILTTGSSWCILGRLTIPGTAAAATALRMVSDRMLAEEIPEQGTRSSSTFGDLTGTDPGPVVPDVAVSASGKALVMLGATISTGGDTYSGGLMGFTISGATTRAATVADSLEFSMSAESFSASASRSILVTGLNSGVHTFTAKYGSAVDGVAFTCGNRNLVVFAL